MMGESYMKVLNSMWEPIKKILGEQELIRDVEYRNSKYVMCVDHMLLNCLTGELIEDSQDYEYKIHHWFMLPKEYDDEDLASRVRKIVCALREGGRNNSKGYYTIYTTLSCNANCFYCYEKEWSKTSHMSLETADNVASFIMQRSKDHEISVEWFGGEPLCNTAVIDHISRKLKSFESTIVTNGLLFSEKNIHKATDLWNLKEVTISMDGKGETYNRTKSYTESSLDPYNTILNNITGLLDKNVKVVVRMIAGEHNLDNLYELVDDLENKFGKDKAFFVEINVLDKSNGAISDEQEYLLKRYLTGKLQYREYNSFDSQTLPQRCRATSLIITPEGKIQFCPDSIDKNYVGDVNEHEIPQDAVIMWKRYKADESVSCMSCELFPSCRLLLMCPLIPIDWNERECYYRKKFERRIRKFISNYIKERRLNSYERNI